MSEALKPSEVLSRAADLIEPEGAWVQEVYARNADGESLYPSGGLDEAVCWCMEGALCAAAKEEDVLLVLNSSAAAFVKTALSQGASLHHWNDDPDRTQAEVVAALRKAADLAREADQ